MKGDSLCVAWKILATDSYHDGVETIFKSPDLTYGRCMQSVTWTWCICMHLCPDMSKGFPFVLSDLFTRAAAFECMFTVLTTYSHMCVLYCVWHWHMNTPTGACMHAYGMYIIICFPVMFPWLQHFDSKCMHKNVCIWFFFLSLGFPTKIISAAINKHVLTLFFQLCFNVQ